MIPLRPELTPRWRGSRTALVIVVALIVIVATLPVVSSVDLLGRAFAVILLIITAGALFDRIRRR